MRILGFALLAIVLLVAAALYYVDTIAEQAVERGTRYATGAPTVVDRVDVGLFSGELRVEGLHIRNPSGFEGQDFLVLDGARLAVRPRSLLDPVVHVPEFTIDGLGVHLERRDGSLNAKTILDHLRSLGSGTEGAQPAGSGGAEKRFVVDLLTVRGLRARGDLAPELGDAGRFALELPPLTLRDLGRESGGLTVAELSQTIALAVLQQIGAARDQLPEALQGALADFEQRREAIESQLDSAREQAESRAEREIRERARELQDEAGRLLQRN